MMFPATQPLIPSKFVVGGILALVVMMGAYAFPSAYAQRAGSSGPQTWHVSVGGQSPDGAVQGEAYYPHVITVDVGDIVVWTLSSGEPHTVTFFGTGPVPADCLEASDFSPCPVPPPSPYDGTSFAGSGLMLPPGFNWDNNFPLPHGNDTFSLTFGNPGAFVYLSVVQAGMQGLVILPRYQLRSMRGNCSDQSVSSRPVHAEQHHSRGRRNGPEFYRNHDPGQWQRDPEYSYSKLWLVC